MTTSRPNIWIATKTFPYVQCTYRYWRAVDRSRYLRSYSFKPKIVLESRHLDNRDMVVTRGETIFNELDLMLTLVFRDKIVVAEDDPLLNQFRSMADSDMCQISILPGVGLEKIAEGIYNHAKVTLFNMDLINRVDIRSVELDDGMLNIAYVV